MRKIFAGLIFGALTLVACSSDESNGAIGGSSDILRYVPSDTPYVFASLEPVPDAVADKFEPTVDKMLKTYQRVLRLALEARIEKMSSEDGNDEDIARTEAVAEEVLGLMSIDGIRAAGIGRESAFALYGNGLLPVLRFELTNEKSFDAAIARIEEKSGHQMEVGEAQGEKYRYVDLDKVKVVIATIGGQAVVTAIPVKFDEAQVALALGISTPGESLAGSGKLGDLQKQYDFSGYMIGYIDSVRIGEIFTGGATGLDNELFAVLDYEAPDLSDVCRAELTDLVSIAPRMVFGYSAINVDYLDSLSIIELREDIANGLATLPTPVPGLGIDAGDFLSMGFSVDLLKAREFYEARITALEDDPFECEMFEKLQATVTQGRAMLSQPVPPVVYTFRGALMRLTDFDDFDFSGGKPPEGIEATATFAIEDAGALLSMGSMFVPELAALNLSADGKAVKLDMPQLKVVADVAYAAMSEGALALSFGDNAEDNAASALTAKSGTPAPFFSMTMDAARYYEILSEAMMQNSDDADGAAEDAMSMEMREAMRDAMLLSGELYERMLIDVLLTERGVEFDIHMTLAD